MTGHTEILRAQPAGATELFPAPQALNVPAAAAALNDTARFLAGLPALEGQNALPRLRSMSAWKAHSVELGGMWEKFAQRHGVPLNAWARTEIADLRTANAVLYPVSYTHLTLPTIYSV